jgi:uncharacterized repeat protein (TIGR01451 family)
MQLLGWMRLLDTTDLNCIGGKRVNVDRRWLGTSVVRVRVLAAALVMLAAGCMVLGWGSRSRHMAANAAADPSSLQASIQNLGLSTPSSLATPSAQSQARSLLAGLPLMFEPNQGQANLDPADRRAQFIARGSGYSLMLGSEGAILNLRSPDQRSDHKATRIDSLRMKLANANPSASLSGGDLLPSKSNYILGNDPAKWRHDVPQFARVRYENVYPGISLAFYGNQGKLEYDFQVAPGSDPTQAELQFDGAKQLKLQDGNLVIEAPDGVVRLDAPHVYQQLNGQQQPVEGSFVLRADNHVGFAIGNYDHSRELVIDPVLNYSTYFGGNGDEHSTQLALDNVGNIYIAGSTTSTNLPAAASVFQTTLNGTQNIYIAKIQILHPLSLQYVTYLGGNDKDTPAGLAVDAAGDPFVAGTTSSTNFPTTTTAYQQSAEPGSAGTEHVFVTGLNSTATRPLLYSTYLSGNGDDVASGVTIDARGNVYVTGTTTSSDAPTSAVQFPASTLPQGLAYQNISRAPIQFFVTKVNTQASGTGSIAYSTYFGGANSVTAPVAVGGGIAVDANGNIYFTGTTNFTYTGCQGCNTTDFPILNAYQPCLDQAPTTSTGNPPTCTAPANGATDAFVAKLNPSAQGSQLQWSTYFGGTANDSGTAVALDPVGAANVYLAGTTNSTDVTTLTTFAAYQRCLDTPVNPAAGTLCNAALTANDAYVARLTNPATSTVATNVSLSYFSYLGGSGDDAGLALTVDPANGAVVTGWTQSADFPITPNSIQGHLLGPQDAFVARLNTVAVTGQNSVASWAVYFGGTGTDEGTGVALDANENVYVAGDTNSTDLQVDQPLAANATNSGGFDAFVAQLATASSLTVTGQLQSGPNQTYIAAGSQATFVYTVTNNGPDLATNITVTDDLTTTGIPVTFVSASATSGTCSGGSTSTNVSCNIQSLQSGSTATVTIVLTPTPNPNGGASTFNGGKVSANSPNNITPNQASVSAKMSDFGIQVAPSSVSVPVAGAPAPYQVQLTPNPVYPSNISLSCTGAPTGAACVFTPPSVTLNSTSPSAPTLIITTTARPVPLPAFSMFSLRFLGLWLPVPGLALIGIGMGRDRRRRRMLGLFLLCLISALILLQPACSGGNNTQPPPTGTPAGSYTITVTATSGSDTKSAAVGLVVP